jgi:hypothetical protein
MLVCRKILINKMRLVINEKKLIPTILANLFVIFTKLILFMNYVFLRATGYEENPIFRS